MPPGPSDSKVTTPTQRNAEIIMNRLSDYLSVRFDHAGRINPRLKPIKHDLMYHELANVRRCIMGDKIYGPVRQVVADVFMSDDDKRRRGLMSPTDQTSIQVELVSHCQGAREAHTETTRGQVRIHDLKTFYASIDSSLSDMMDLIETWIWWDILDAAELSRFEQKLGLISIARQGRLSEEARKRYAVLIQPASSGEEQVAPTQAITDEDVIRYEFKLLTQIRDQWVNRRNSERGFMFVLKRDELPAPNQGESIHNIAVHVREYDTIDQMDDLDEDARHRYAPSLRVTPDKVTRQGVLDYLQNQLIAIEREMLSQSDQESRLGPPYNYKERQLEQMDKWLYDLGQQMRGIIKTDKPGETPAPPPKPPAGVPAG